MHIHVSGVRRDERRGSNRTHLLAMCLQNGRRREKGWRDLRRGMSWRKTRPKGGGEGERARVREWGRENDEEQQKDTEQRL